MLKKFTGIILLLGVFVTVFHSTAWAESPLQGYTYNSWSQSVSAPNTYECTDVIQGTDLGVGRFNKPSDLYYDDKANELVILDTDRIVILDGNFKLIKEISEFVSADGNETLNKASGIFVDGKGMIYVADTDNGRVLTIDRNKSPNVVDILKYDNLEIDTQEMPFRPVKVLKDSSDNIYVLSVGCYMGAIVFDKDKKFIGFYGSNQVEATLEVLMDAFWKSIMSSEQKSALSKYVPMEYTSFDIGSDGFIYTCTSTNKTGVEQVRKLNTMGNNILVGRTTGNNIDTSKFGDIELNTGGVSNNFSDIAIDSDGFMYVLDQAFKKAYWYNTDGELIGTFGTKGEVKGTFSDASAIETMGTRAVVLDAENGTINVFERTEFGNIVAGALLLYNDGLYEEAMVSWQEVVAMCSNYELAYTSIGKALYNNKDYKQAMKYFKLSYNREDYSDAYKEYRTEKIRNNAVWVVLIMAVLIVGLWLLWRKRAKFLSWYEKRSIATKNRVSKIAYPFKTMRHISDNFEELKTEKESSVYVAIGLLVAFFLCCVINARYKGFIFNFQKAADFNVLILLASTIGLFLLWCICNWAVTTLLEGKGKLKHIFMVSIYSLVPTMMAMLISIGLSWVLTMDEGVFLQWILYAGILWTAVMLIKGLSEIHEYSGGKIVVSVTLTVFVMLAAVFLGVLMFSLVSQLTSFVKSIFVEMSFRYF